MLRKNKMWILEKPKHVTAMIAWFSEDQVLTESLSKGWEKYGENFDLYFVFSKGLEEKYDLKKYSSLHMAKGYVVSEDTDPCQSMIWTLKYFREFMGSMYIGFYLRHSNPVFTVDEEKDVPELVRVSQCPLNIGIMRYSKESFETLEKLYTLPEKKSLLFGWKYLGSDPRGMYSTHRCNGDLIYLRPWIIDKMLNFLVSDSIDYTIIDGSLFLDSFQGQPIGDFLASWIIRTGEPEKYFLNIDFKDVKA